MDSLPLPEKKYGVIYADPPWAYRAYSKKGNGRSAESHYPTMDIEDIKALPVGGDRGQGCGPLYVGDFPMLARGFSGD